MSLDELLRALRDSEPRADHHLFQRLHSELLQYFRRRVDTPDAEELTQHALEIVHTQLEEFRPETSSSFRSYVFTTALHRLLSHRRKLVLRRRHREPPGEWIATPPPPPDEEILWRERQKLFREAMAELRSTLRRAIESRLREDDPREFAEAEGIDLSGLRGRVRRAVAALREIILARGGVPREQTQKLT